MKYFYLILITMAGLLYSSPSVSKTHAYQQNAAPLFGYERSLYLTQGVFREYGDITRQGAEGTSDLENKWSGYGVKNSLGIELLGFFQCGLSYEMLQSTINAAEPETADGSRISLDTKLIFGSPLFNLETIAGGFMTFLNTRQNNQVTEFSGNGRYWGLGINYGLSETLHIYGNYRNQEEELRRQNGIGDFEGMKRDGAAISMGLRVWL